MYTEDGDAISDLVSCDMEDVTVEMEFECNYYSPMYKKIYRSIESFGMSKLADDLSYADARAILRNPSFVVFKCIKEVYCMTCEYLFAFEPMHDMTEEEELQTCNDFGVHHVMKHCEALGVCT
jgi:hypothetical protein